MKAKDKVFKVRVAFVNSDFEIAQVPMDLLHVMVEFP